MTGEPLFDVSNLEKWFDAPSNGIIDRLRGTREYIKAIDDINFSIEKGEILGVAGQSGCGKSTLGELLVGLQQPTGGTIQWDGDDLTAYDKKDWKEFRRECQVIFQDPYESLNPRLSVARCVGEPLAIHGIGDKSDREERIIEALQDAGLEPAESYLDQLPSELSGGERQRVCIARALVLEPSFILADEPVSMLDVSIQSSILNLFEKLQKERGLTLLYISHNIETINYIADRTAIMYLGNLVEIGDTESVIHDPAHPYTESLVNAVPHPTPNSQREGSGIEGDVPDPINLPDGCRFKDSCQYATEKCGESEPLLEEGGSPSRDVACYHPLNKRT